MKNSLDLKRFHVHSALSDSPKTKHQYTFFMGALKLICSGISQEKFLKTKIDLPVNTPQSAIFGFPNYSQTLKIILNFLK